jgi:hypothetical protein
MMAARRKRSMLPSPTGLKGQSRCTTLENSKSSYGEGMRGSPGLCKETARHYLALQYGIRRYPGPRFLRPKRTAIIRDYHVLHRVSWEMGNAGSTAMSYLSITGSLPIIYKSSIPFILPRQFYFSSMFRKSLLDVFRNIFFGRG